MRIARLATIVSALGFLFAISTTALAQTLGGPPSQIALPVPVPSVVGRSFYLHHTNPSQVLHLSISLPYANLLGMETMVNSISDPRSRNYRNFLTPDQIGQQFGLSTAQVQSVSSYLVSKGFTIRLIAKNHLSILADATVTQAESAFGTTVNDYQVFNQNEPGNPTFHSFSTPLHVPATLGPLVSCVNGLESFSKPRPRTTLTPAQSRTLYSIAPTYNGGRHGEGRTVGISNFQGFRLTNVPLFYSQYSLPAPTGGVGTNIAVETISNGAGGDPPQGEADLDIQMVLAQAPLCNLIIYDAGQNDLIGALTLESNDNKCDTITESYGWNIDGPTAASAHNLHLSMNAEGITYMVASGDSGTQLEPFSYPNYEPEVLMVGGTAADTDANGVRTTEVGWFGSGGGWVTAETPPFNVLPSWQKGTGVPTNINFRLNPDVALHAFSDQDAYFLFLNGSLTALSGTSAASPTFAGGLAVAEQQIIANGGLPANGSGKQRFGRINDLIYSFNGRSDIFFDVTSGSNGPLPGPVGGTGTAGPGWDFVTGWGSINWAGFITATSSNNGSVPLPPTNLKGTPGNGSAILTWNVSSGATAYKVYRGTTSGGPYTNIATVGTNSFTNTGLTNGTTYYFVVTAGNTSGYSGNSNEVSVKPTNGQSAPLPPTNLTAVAGNTKITLSWNASATATTYRLYRAAVSGGPYTLLLTQGTLNYVNTGLTNGTTYFYVVTAGNAVGYSGNSNEASAKPQGPPPLQILLNPGFESGNVNWIATPGVIDNTGGKPAHGGAWKAWLNGYGTTHTDTCYQQVVVPATFVSASLSYWIHIDTDESTTTTAYDKLLVQVRDANNVVLATLKAYSNLDQKAGFTQYKFDMTAYKGKTIRIYLLGTEDTTLQTSFVLDDFVFSVQQ
jgi:subtilase family serine protease